MEFQYKGLCATLERMNVTEEEIDRQVERLNGQDTSEFTPEELRQGVAQSLQSYYDAKAEEDLLDKLIRMAADTLDYEPTEEEIDRGTQAQLESFAAQLAQRNLTLEAYCSFMNTDEKTLKEDMRSDARNLLRIQKTGLEIARLEGLTAEKEDIDQLCQDICRANQMSAEDFAKYYDDAMAQTLKETVLCNKALALVRENAVITEVTR